MHTQELKVLAVLLISIGIQSNFGSASAPTIKIHVTDNDTDIPLLYNVDRCIPVIPKSKSGHIHAIDTNGNCINIYSEENCVGKFIRIKTSRSFNNVSKMAAHRWDDDILVDNENITVGSIGPCFKKCDPQNWAGMRSDISTNVTLYGDQNYTGRNYTYSISGMECIETPSFILTLSIKISGTSSTTCVELHDDATCRGSTIQLRPGYPNLREIWLWGFNRENSAAVFVKAVSLCGNSCSSKPTSVWVILLIMVVILLALGVAGYGGVYFFRRSRNVQQECHNVRYNKSQAENS